MCGIVGYIGNRSCRQVVLDGLARLEYRGYDSAGFACIDTDQGCMSFHKEIGEGQNPVQRLAENMTCDGLVGIGHTRWATHGVVDLNNTHPHFNCKRNIAVVHNGIIEGFAQLRDELRAKGHRFVSTTDTEVVAHLLSDLLRSHTDLKQAMFQLVSRLTGAYALVFLFEENPESLVVVRHKSPMVLGIGKHEVFAASDVMAFSDKTSNVLFMPDDSIAFLTKESVELYSFDGKPLSYYTQQIDQTFSDVGKEGFEHYMLKEIYEQKRAITRTVKTLDDNKNLLKQLKVTKRQLQSLRYINLLAAGTSWHAARIAQFFFEALCKIPTRVYLASEYRYMPFFAEPKSLYIMVSQSGETADTLEALRLINSFDQHTIALSNVAASSMIREAKGSLLMHAGPEISVASTKAFSTQMATLYWLAHRFALERGQITEEQMQEAVNQLLFGAEILETTIENYKHKIVKELAPRYATYERFIFLGRHVSYPFAMEAALKLKEISYIFAQCYPSGELKHGPIALIDSKTPVVLFSVLDDLIYSKMIGNAQEIKARKGHLIVFAFEGQQELIDMADCAFIIPKVAPLLAPLAMTGIMQTLVYYITLELGHPIDKPRNLAKAVTVE
jgi:glutamine---fructose-6-phosphate transaminase (isomerizing)